MARKEIQNFPDARSAARFTLDTVLEIWGTNSTLEDKTATLEVTAFDLQSDWTERWSKKITLLANASTELFDGGLPGQPTRVKKSDVKKDIIVAARLIDNDGTVLARYANW
jgi:beta-mannosidase